MKCDLCNGEITTIIGSVNFKSKMLGTVSVPAIKHSKCMNCGEILIDYSESKKAHAYIIKREIETLKSLPIGDFISANIAADILGITKQAFSKHSRIKRGFIYSVTQDDGKKRYYKKSVEEFKRTGKDGRLALNVQNRETYKRTKHTISYERPAVVDNKFLYQAYVSTKRDDKYINYKNKRHSLLHNVSSNRLH